ARPQARPTAYVLAADVCDGDLGGHLPLDQGERFPVSNRHRRASLPRAFRRSSNPGGAAQIHPLFGHLPDEALPAGQVIPGCPQLELEGRVALRGAPEAVGAVGANLAILRLGQLPKLVELVLLDAGDTVELPGLRLPALHAVADITIAGRRRRIERPGQGQGHDRAWGNAREQLQRDLDTIGDRRLKLEPEAALTPEPGHGPLLQLWRQRPDGGRA